MPASVSQVELAAMADVAKYAAGGALIASLGLAIGWGIRRPIGMSAGGALLAFALVAHGVFTTRAEFRHRMYAATAAPTGAPYDIVPIYPVLAAWQIWEGLDGDTPARIAFAAGWDGFNGHTVFRYPLLGSRLQNTVSYVPPTRDGDVIDYQHRDRLLPHLDFHSWLQRLVDHRIDFVVVSVPGAPELGWMRGNPDVFVPFKEDPSLWTFAFRVADTEAQALLSARDAH